MKRAMKLTGVLVFFGLVFIAKREIDQVEKNIDYYNAHILNPRTPSIGNLKDSVAENHPLKGKYRTVRRPLAPEEIKRRSGWFVKVRVFRWLLIPATHQAIPVDTGSFGSGSIVPCEKYVYCVLTAFHVLGNGKREEMAYFAEAADRSPAQLLELVAGSTKNDAALFRFANPSYAPKFVGTLGNSESLPGGAKVVALGSDAFGDFWISVGHTHHAAFSPSGIFREALKSGGARYRRIIPSDTAIYLGYSGGPLLNEYNEIVGINVSVINLDWRVVTISIPINDIRKEFKILK